MSEEASEIRKLMMLISDLRSKDTERYEQHVAFMNEVVSFIKKISDSMNENWMKVNESLQKLNKTIEENLNILLSGINPEGIRETSKNLKEIMDTMSRSMQSMNLESLMREVKSLTGGVSIQAISPVPKTPQEITSGLNSPYSSSESIQQSSTEEPEIYGYVPGMKKSTKKKEEDTHLIKPSDLFK